jgi:hypothetical protein
MAAKPSASRSSASPPPAARNGTPNGRHSTAAPAAAANGSAASKHDKQEAKILFQKYFKSVGPRTYAAQLKEAGNGNHFLVLTEGKRDPVTNEIKKLKLFVYSEDFPAYFRMLHETAQFIKAHPVSPEIKMKRMRYWAKKEAEQATAAREAAERQAAAKPRPVSPAKVTAKPPARKPARGR